MKRWTALAATVALTLPIVGLAGTPTLTGGERGLDFYFLDVEGGAATLMVTPNRESVLVDSGWPALGDRDPMRIEHVAKYVAGLDHIDHYLTTHWHTDHYGGIEGLTKRMPVRHFWDRGVPPEATDKAEDFPLLIAAYQRASGGKHTKMSAGDRIPLTSGSTPIEMIAVSSGGKVIGEGKREIAQFCKKHPSAPVPDSSDNMLSLGTMVKFGDRFRFMNLGDLTWNIEHKLACPKNRVGQIDLWQVTHHGAPQSSNPALVEAIRPQVAIMVNGARKGGDPHTVATLKNSKSLEALYQLHLNVATGPDDNTSPERIANLDEKCSGEFLAAHVNADGTRYTITKGATKPLQTYRVR
jgi:beta-lactamase superfamily II metal-dependent hydrolase